VQAINLNEEMEQNNTSDQQLPSDTVVDQTSSPNSNDNANEVDLDFYCTH